MHGNKGSFLIGRSIADFRLDSKEIRKIKIIGKFYSGMRFSRNSEKKFQNAVLNYLLFKMKIFNSFIEFGIKF